MAVALLRLWYAVVYNHERGMLSGDEEGEKANRSVPVGDVLYLYNEYRHTSREGQAYDDMCFWQSVKR